MANPQLVAHDISFDKDNDWNCDSRGCAWWDDRLKCCSIFSLMIAIKGIARSMRRLDNTERESEDDF